MIGGRKSSVRAGEIVFIKSEKPAGFGLIIKSGVIDPAFYDYYLIKVIIDAFREIISSSPRGSLNIFPDII